MDLRSVVSTVRELGWDTPEASAKRRAFPEGPMTFVEIDAGWSTANYPGLMLVSGSQLTDRDRTRVFGFVIAKVGSWFDAWLERAKGDPNLRAQRDVLDEGLIVWFEEPTRAAIVRRLAELNASRATTSADRVVASATNAADAWSKLVAARLLPESWLNDPRRLFRHRVRTECETCRGFGYSDCYERCDNGYHVTDAWKPSPETVSECAGYAELHELMALYEMLALELLTRVKPWVEKTAREPIARWSMWSSKSYGPQVPAVLEPAWQALRAVGANPHPQDLSAVRGAPGWAGQGQRAWEDAVVRGLRIKATYPVPASAVGLAFADLENPFVFASELESLPFRFFKLEENGIYLWAWDRRGSE